MIHTAHIVIVVLLVALFLSLAFSYRLFQQKRALTTADFSAPETPTDDYGEPPQQDADTETDDAPLPDTFLETATTEMPQPLNDFDQQFLNRLNRLISDGMKDNSLTIDALAKGMHISRSQLNRRVHAITNQSTTNYVLQIRMKEACRLLLADLSVPVAEVAQHCGFEDPAYFTRVFKNAMGVSPTAYRKQ